MPTYAGPSQLRVVAIFGGVGMGPQLEALRRGVDVVVATPGRLIDHVQRRSVDLSSIEMLILDEADRMLDMGFLPPLKRIAAALPRERQTLLFSATLPDDVINLSKQFTRSAVRVDVSGEQVVAVQVTHQVHHVTVDRKRDVLTDILTQDDKGQALVFCRTKRGANRVGEDLGFRGIRAGVIHGNKSQSARNRALDDFKTGRVRVLVATDIAARGLDIARLPLVVNFDLPLVAEDYVHRVGRTGRAGHDGRAVSLVSARTCRCFATFNGWSRRRSRASASRPNTRRTRIVDRGAVERVRADRAAAGSAPADVLTAPAATRSGAAGRSGPMGPKARVLKGPDLQYSRTFKDPRTLGPLDSLGPSAGDGPVPVQRRPRTVPSAIAVTLPAATSSWAITAVL